ncbi:MAG: protein kinase [Myxococcota bacterium]
MSTPSNGSGSSSLFPRPIDDGVVVDGRYQIIRELGRGGMGAVYEAEQIKLKKRVALKVLQGDRIRRDDGGSSLKRFLREARAASSIKHRNVVDIIDFGDLDDGSTYYVMELLEGHDLSSLLKTEGRMEWPRARLLLRQVLSALWTAHDNGIVHRDIKPANIVLLNELDEWGDEWVKVLDFGIAKVQSNDEDSQALTGTSELLGTAAYMAPELVRGDTPDARADLYAVGIVAYQLLTGSVPFSGANTFQVLLQHTNEYPQSPRERAPQLPRPVEAFVLRALAKEPQHRYQSAAEMIEAIDALGDAPSEDLSFDSRPVEPIVRVNSTEVADRFNLADRRRADTKPNQRTELHLTPPSGPGTDPTRRLDSQPIDPSQATVLLHDSAPHQSSIAPAPKNRWVMPLLLVMVTALTAVVAWLVIERTSSEPTTVSAASPRADGGPSEPAAMGEGPTSTPTDPAPARGSGTGGPDPADVRPSDGTSDPEHTDDPDDTDGSGDTSDTDPPSEREEDPTTGRSIPVTPPPVSNRSPRSCGYACQQKKAEKKLRSAVKRQCRAKSNGDTVTIKLTIGTDGRVLMPRALAPHGHTALGQCVADVVAGAKFPAPPRLTSKQLKYKP